jgi:hypothetical protein
MPIIFKPFSGSKKISKALFIFKNFSVTSGEVSCLEKIFKKVEDIIFLCLIQIYILKTIKSCCNLFH